MTYATQDDLATRYGANELLQLADRDGDGIADPGVIEGALAEASAEIDLYLQGRYALPLTHPLLTTLACDIARYRLWKDEATDRVRNAATDARRMLDHLASGKITLDRPTTPTGGAQVQSITPPAVFDRDGLAGF